GIDGQDQTTQNPRFTPDQLDNLLAPLALYPDPLLAQILPAATFPDQIDAAEQFVSANNDPDAIDAQAWDPSVMAIAHYPPVLKQLADDLDWCTALGQAWVAQPDDVMASIQRLRQQAEDAGNLQSMQDAQVMTDAVGDIEILPLDGGDLYVPLYDPAVAFYEGGGPEISYNLHYRVGPWLNSGIDWRKRRVVHGSDRAANPVDRPHSDVRATAAGNRDVLRREVNWAELSRYRSVHRDTKIAPAAA